MSPPIPEKFDSRFAGLEKDPVFRRKRKATVIMFILRMFLLGAEYAIILPSIWLYLDTFKVEPWFLGLVIAVYPTASVISLPVVGMFFDKTKRIKELVLILNGFEIIGNIVYALPYSKWLVFFGRMLAGLGDGFYACANTEIVYTYPMSERTGIFALLEVGRVLGLTFGPALNFFLATVDFKIGDWSINFGTAPGVFMALLWILSQILTMFYISNLSKLIDERSKYCPNIQLDSRGPPQKEYEIDYKRVRETSLCESVLDVNYGDEEPLIKRGGRPAFRCYQTMNGKMMIDDELTEDDEFFQESSMDEPAVVVTKSSTMQLLLQLCTMEVLSIFFSDLVLWLAQTEFEVLLPLVTQEDYGWGEREVSAIYMVGGVWLMFVFFLIYKFGDKTNVKDQHYVVISLLLTILALLFLMCEQIPDEKNKKTRVGIFLSICVVVFSAIPLNLVAIKSLVTKLTPRDSQGVTQGVYSSISRVTLILGPLLAGICFNHRLVFGALMATSCIIALIWVVLSLRKIRSKIALMEEIDS
ncbi:uncharacterized protein LOC130642174 [Hydractinia symbiolongicarpus]|uniref:uncharacterized protein LOC130642174 n=1 Tax=Hydractinia symbiolongicarpus TaxID=13093 RepID=UPI00254CE0F2|nr:uncharacterized protein LOC130642174 [Hydractinia symbiolongicarpus]